MRIVDDNYLRALSEGTLEIPEISLESSMYNILLLSDVHLPAPRFASDAQSRARGFERHISREFQPRFNSLVGSLGEGKNWHLLVNCGDILRGADVKKYEEGFENDTDAFETYKALYGDFARRALDYSKYKAGASHILSVPGNHDVYRNGAVIDDEAKKGLRRHEPYYRDFASTLNECQNGDLKDQQNRPCVFFAKVSGPDEGSVPLAYVAVIGFDSNHAEYDFSYVTDLGTVSDEQIAVARKDLIPALKIRAADAPLYIIAVMHHHLLPLEKLKITGNVEDGRTDLYNQRSTLNCLRCVDEKGGEVKPETVADVCVVNQMKANNTAGATTNAPDLINFFQEQRFSLIVHGHMHSKKLRVLSELAFEHSATEQQITILSCPSFNRGTDYRGFKGIIGVGLDLSAGEAQIICTAEQEDPADNKDLREKTVQAVRPLTSVSRVSASEMRLYRCLISYLRNCPEVKDEYSREKVVDFECYVRKTFQHYGYVPVCNASGKDLFFLRPMQRRRYFLLLLLKDDTENRFSMLLNRHTPITVSSLANWDTLLFPAFSSARDLLSHLLNDILRQHMEVAERAEDAERIKKHIESLKQFLADESREPEYWEKMLRMVSTPRKFIKFSPTDGFPIEYEYTLVTLDALVSFSEGQEYRDFRDFMRRMPALSYPDEEAPWPGANRHVFPLDVLHNYGSGLRSNPESQDPDRGDNKERYTRALPHGAIWFPITPPGKNEPRGYWRDCPSIVARNGDVMEWVDEELQKLGESGRYPTEVLLGRHNPASAALSITSHFPFTSNGEVGEEASPEPVDSTRDALRRVKCDGNYDLRDEVIYGDRNVMRVVLRKSPCEQDNYGRRMIEVFEYDGQDSKPSQDGLEEVGKKLGVLRPVQRYVLHAGLERATRVNEEVLDKLRDRWGYAKVETGSPMRVTVTPPILELLPGRDCEGDDGSQEFIVCDGNHRIVQRVWNEEKAMAAVAIVAAPEHPYYAHPFSKYEWGITADNELRFVPDVASKYAARRVGQDDIDKLTGEAKALLTSTPESERYRRYFRDLATGFGYMGGQGGKPG